jgi:hypothetical protein
MLYAVTVQIALKFHPMLVHFVAEQKFVLVRVQLLQLVVMKAAAVVVIVAVAIVVEIVVNHVDIAAVAGNSNRVGVIVLYIAEAPVVDNIGIVEVPVEVDTCYIAVVGTADSRVDKVDKVVQVA